MRHKPDRVETGLTLISRDLYKINKFLTVTVDVIFLKGKAFLTALSSKIVFLTVEHIPSHTATQIRSYLNRIVNIYTRRGFTVRVICMDVYFEKVSDDM